MSKFWSPVAASILLLVVSCSNEKSERRSENKPYGRKNEKQNAHPWIRWHFHCHLVKKSMYDSVYPKVMFMRPMAVNEGLPAGHRKYNTRTVIRTPRTGV